MIASTSVQELAEQIRRTIERAKADRVELDWNER